MARAGFYAVESGKISFRRDGNWYSDEDRIDNPRIALLFSKSIRRNPDGSYYLQVAEERASITIEDTPYVVKSVEDDGSVRDRAVGDRDGDAGDRVVDNLMLLEDGQWVCARALPVAHDDHRRVGPEPLGCGAQ